MKKTLQIIIMAVLICTVLFALCACTSDNSTGTNINNKEDELNVKPTPKPEPVTAYSQLTNDEKTFFGFFSDRLSSFKSPSSVRVIEVESYDKKALFAVNVSATNGFGGTTSQIYYFYTTGQVFDLYDQYIPAGKLVTADEIEEIGTAADIVGFMQTVNNKADAINYNTKRINDALKEYMVEQGWVD